MKNYKAIVKEKTVPVNVCPVCSFESQSPLELHIAKHEFDELKKAVRWFGDSGHFQYEHQLKEFLSFYEREWNAPFDDWYDMKYEWKGPGEYGCGNPVQVKEDADGYRTFEVWFWRRR